MKKSRYTEEQITYALRQAESGTPVADVCRQLGVSEASFYVWKKKYGKLGMSEIRELRQLREENSRLKRLVADLKLDMYSDNLDEKGATIWMRSLVSRQTHHDGRFARPQACCLAICRAATPLRWF